MTNPWINQLKKVSQDNPKLTYNECMIKGKKSYKKKQKGDGFISDNAGSLWKAVKTVGKVAAVATLAIPATALIYQAALAAYLASQPDGGTAMVNKGIKAFFKL